MRILLSLWDAFTSPIKLKNIRVFKQMTPEAYANLLEYVKCLVGD